MFEPPEGYYLAFSGGKDSQAVYHLARRAGVKFEAVYRITSVDPPELIRFIKEKYPEVRLEFPRDSDGRVITMWNLIPKKKIPPTRFVRYCCERLKESGGNGRLTLTGVRWAESHGRKNNQGFIRTKGKRPLKAAKQNNAKYKENSKGGIVLNYDDDATRRTVEQCYRTNKTILNPIIDWETDEVWEYLNEVERVEHCVLYDEGYERLGCIGCPMSCNAKKELERWPKYRQAYIRAFERMLDARKEAGLETQWENAEAVMRWWTKN
jgi:phosphoadenosine phosphosulfate reductase